MTNAIYLPELAKRVQHVAPKTPRSLWTWIDMILSFEVARTVATPGHVAPFEYIQHAYFNDPDLPRDCIVWANRGGGKTQLGAIATLLDLLFKPGIQIRILGGSLEQSTRMFSALRTMLDVTAWKKSLTPSITGRSITLNNGSAVEILPQSERAVRGQRVHILRCDEVDLFDEDVWQAAQLTTRSGMCGDTYVRGTIEAFSTMHRPGGLMQRLVDDAHRAGRRVFRWNVIDTLRTCPPARDCRSCPLWTDCAGRAKTTRGFLDIDDAVQLRNRVDPETWAVEMVGDRPDTRDLLLPNFDPEHHIAHADRPLRELTACVLSHDESRGLFGLIVDADGHHLHIADELRDATGGLRSFGRRAIERGWRWPLPHVVIDADSVRAFDAEGRRLADACRTMGSTVGRPGRCDPAGIARVRAMLQSHRRSLRIDPRCRTLLTACQRARIGEPILSQEMQSLLATVRGVGRQAVVVQAY
ncbi:MAG: hypothetical protein AAF432_06405 [Planctomycetota bacterium]